VASYLAAHPETLSVATLVCRIATTSEAHETRGLPNPCRSQIVRATLRGVKRAQGVARREAKPLLRENLFQLLDATGEDAKGARDRALLLIGFAGGFRRSEIAALDCDDVERVRQGLVVTLRRSKTDQEGAGRKVGIPFGRTPPTLTRPASPVTACAPASPQRRAGRGVDTQDAVADRSRQHAMLSRYIRDSEMFLDNAASALL
jgi:integrase